MLTAKTCKVYKNSYPETIVEGNLIKVAFTKNDIDIPNNKSVILDFKNEDGENLEIRYSKKQNSNIEIRSVEKDLMRGYMQLLSNLS